MLKNTFAGNVDAIYNYSDFAKLGLRTSNDVNYDIVIYNRVVNGTNGGYISIQFANQLLEQHRIGGTALHNKSIFGTTITQKLLEVPAQVQQNIFNYK